jgi:hypothetical protein
VGLPRTDSARNPEAADSLTWIKHRRGTATEHAQCERWGNVIRATHIKGG